MDEQELGISAGSLLSNVGASIDSQHAASMRRVSRELASINKRINIAAATVRNTMNHVAELTMRVEQLEQLNNPKAHRPRGRGG